MRKDIPVYSTGDLVEYVWAPDQNPYETNRFAGKLGLIIKRCDERDGVKSSSNNIYQVLIDDVYVNLHALDFMLVSKA